ncbi:MAG: 5-(carboxyamino)imidazole ribonucleotide synthase [Actinomyces sp.]|nr:MAG: 5-(carboxyamino)imidazole ribonucleotide synthase [Actinomyces sp.]
MAPSTSRSGVVAPGAVIGVVGGGQLGRMLAAAAHQLGYRVAVFTGGETDTPAGRVAEYEIAAPFDDAEARRAFVEVSDVVTWEFENVDTVVGDEARAAGLPVRPAPELVRTCQDRRREREMLGEAGVPHAPWSPVSSADEILTWCDMWGGRALVKAARGGYDGKSQQLVDPADPRTVAAAAALCAAGPTIAESVVEFHREVSVVVARSLDGTIVDHGVVVNTHVDGILDTSVTCTDPDLVEAATGLAWQVAAALELVGVACVEMFDTGDGLLVNEIAPRPHNSGHLTIEAAAASQFDQQVRTVCGLPLGDGRCRPAAMAQLLGEVWDSGDPDWSVVLARRGVHLHLYGKSEPRRGRKMGHLTVVGDSPDEALERVTEARRALIAAPRLAPVSP